MENKNNKNTYFNIHKGKNFFFLFLNKEAYTPDKLTNKRTQRQIDRLTDGRTLKEHKATTKHMDK